MGNRPPVNRIFAGRRRIPSLGVQFHSFLSLPSLTAAIELNSPRSVSSQFGTSGYHIPPAMNRIIVRWVNDPLDANPFEVRPPLSLSIPHVVGTGLELLGMNYNCGPLSHPAFFNPSSTSETELIDFDDSIIPVSSIGTTSDLHIEQCVFPQSQTDSSDMQRLAVPLQREPSQHVL